MTVAFVRTHTAGTALKAAGTTVDLNISTIVAAGNTIVAYILFDNAATASKPIVSSIAKAAGETANWVSLGAARSTSTSAGSFASGEMWAIQTTVAWPVAVYTVTLDTSTVMKATLAQEFSGLTSSLRSTVGTNYSTTTTAASATTTGTAPVIGDLAIGFMFQSNAAAFATSDTDTTAGSWSAIATFGSTGSSGATNNFGGAQYKILTAATAQTYNAAAALTAGNGAIVAVLQAVLDPLITQASYRFYADGTESGSVALAAQDTAYTANMDAGDVNLLVRTRLQSTNAGVINATDDWQLQWEKNANGTWNDVGPAMLDTYPSVNSSGSQTLYTGGSSIICQSFLGDGRRLIRAGFYASNSGGADGTVAAVLYAHSGTFGSTGTPTGSALATTVAVASSTIGSLRWYYFDFDGTFTLANGTPYFIGLVTTNTVLGGIAVRIDNTSPTHAGNETRFSTSWVQDGTDLLFEVYTASSIPSTAVGYNSPNLTDGAATTNRLGAGTGSFVAGKVSRDGLADDVGWTANNYTELLYAVALKAAALVNADTLRFRVLRNASTFGLTYTQTPTINVTKTAAATGQPKVYLAGAFTKKPLKVYSGSTFVAKPVKQWTGSAWKTLT